MRALTTDWIRFVKMFRLSIIRNTSRSQSLATYNFLNDRVTIGTQSYRRCMISALLLEVIFGTSFSSPNIQESIVYRSKNCIYMYINSYMSIKKVLDINNLSPINFQKKKLQYICCGKFNLVKHKNNITGYVLDEDKHEFKVLLRNDMCVKVKKQKIVSLVGQNQKIKSVHYVYEHILSSMEDQYVVTEFWPIRIKIMKNAMNNMVYVLNKVVLKNDLKVHQILSS